MGSRLERRTGVAVGRWRDRRPAALALVVAMTAVAAAASQPAGRVRAAPVVLRGTVGRLVRRAENLGPADGAMRLRMAVALRLPDRAALDDFVAAQYTPGSPEFHRFLTPAGFGARFGATASDVATVSGALRRLGFHVAPPLANHLLVNFEGSVAQAERAFGTRIARFRAPDGSGFFANTNDITLPAALGATVTNVFGLDDANRRHPQLARRPGANLPPNVPARAAPFTHAMAVGGGASACPQGMVGYTASDFAAAYDFNGLYAAGFHGEGMSAAIVEFDDYHTSDVKTFESCYGISPDPVVRREVDGGLGAPATDGGGEDPLDFDIMLEMLPKLAHLYVYVAPNTDTSELDLFNDFATDFKAPVLSASWGSCEALASSGYTQALGVVAEEAAAQGQQILEASGDSGPVDCRGYPPAVVNSMNVEEEAAIPWVTAVGGTNLNPTSLTGAVRKEVTWNDMFGAGGGGISTAWVMPAWQQDAHGTVIGGTSSGAPCAAPAGKYCRQLPDISANADILGAPRPIGALPNPDGTPGSPGYAYYCGSVSCSLVGPVPVVGNPSGWNVNGGTSASTPLTAAAFVLFDQMAKSKGLSGPGLLNPSIYRVASDPAKYAADFIDITSDTNSDEYAACRTGCNPNHLYPATTGFDLATGWGVYDAAKLGADLVADAGHLDVSPDDVALYGYLGGPATSTSLAVSSGYAALALQAHSDSAWLTAAVKATPGSLTVRADPSGLGAGLYVGHVTLVGGPSHATATVRYTVTPRAHLAATPGTLRFAEYAVDANGKPIAQSCTSTWKDEIEPTLNTSDTTPTPAGSLQTLTIRNTGPSASRLHWSALLETDNGGWLSTDLNPNPGATGEPPGVPVQTQGSIAGGSSAGLKLASIASASSFGNFSYAPGTYRGGVVLTDLADPSVRMAVPAVLVLGDGTWTPRIAAGVHGLTATLRPGGTTTVQLPLADATKRCGYNYTVAVQDAHDRPARWASVPDPAYSGRVGGTEGSAVAASPSTAAVAITVNAAGLGAGTYRALVKVQSNNAEPQPYIVPLTLVVAGKRVLGPVKVTPRVKGEKQLAATGVGGDAAAWVLLLLALGAAIGRLHLRHR